MRKFTFYIDDPGPKVDMTAAGAIDETEYCVVCGRKTAARRDMHIGLREYYVHGGGQLCHECFAALYSEVQAGQKINERF